MKQALLSTKHYSLYVLSLSQCDAQANIGKEGVLGPRISRDRHYSNLYEYSTSAADYVVSGGEVVISTSEDGHPRRSDSASPTGSSLSSSGGSVSPIQQQQQPVMESWPKKRGRSNTTRPQSTSKQVAGKLAAQSSTCKFTMIE